MSVAGNAWTILHPCKNIKNILASERKISDRLKQCLEDQKRSGIKGELARHCGVEASTVTRWLKDETTPTVENAIKMAAFFGMDANWLMTGENAESSTSPKKSGVSKTTHRAWEELPSRASAERMVPVIGWAHAGDAGGYEEIPPSWQNRVPTDCSDPKAFGVSLEGDSMEPKFSDGDILIVQPTTEAHSGCFVVARFIDDSVIFRRLEMRRGKIILVPLNPQYMASEHTPEEFSWIYPVWARITKMWKR